MSVMGAVAPARADAAVFGGRALKLRHRARIAPRAVVTRRVVAKAVAEASEATKLNKSEWSSLGSVCAVLGSQWGDEGKGKLVDILAQVRPPKRVRIVVQTRRAGGKMRRPIIAPRGDRPRRAENPLPRRLGPPGASLPPPARRRPTRAPAGRAWRPP
jgi:hypothetical protein